MMPPERLLEFALITWEFSCKDPSLFDDGDFRECRRERNHEGKHASGFHNFYREWGPDQ